MNDFFSSIANLGLFGVFLGLAIVGIAIFLIAFIFDGIFDGILNLDLGGADVPLFQMVGVFLGVGGGTGLITLGLGITEPILIILAAVLVGFLMAALFGLFMNKLQKTSNQEHPVDPTKVVGSAVSVSWWDGSEGEVLVSLGGNLFKVHAESEEALVRPSKLLVTDVQFSGDKPIKVTVKKL